MIWIRPIALVLADGAFAARVLETKAAAFYLNLFAASTQVYDLKEFVVRRRGATAAIPLN